MVQGAGAAIRRHVNGLLDGSESGAACSTPRRQQAGERAARCSIISDDLDWLATCVYAFFFV